MPLNIEKFKIEKETPIPLYYQLKQYVLECIQNKELEVGEQLPNEMDLIEILRISRSTVRQALNELVSEGYLYRVKAKGTFVAKPKVDEGFFQKLESFNTEMIQKGLRPSTKVLDLKVIKGIEAINKKLKMNSEEPLIYLRRIRCADQEPVVYFETYLPYAKYPKILEEDFTVESLYSKLEEKYGCRVLRALREIEATIANPEELKYLNINKGAAICLVKTVAFNSEDIPVEYSIARYRGDRNKFTVELVRK